MTIVTPDFIKPQQPTFAEEPPSKGQWFYELKYNGYRGQARLEDGRTTIRTRNNNDWTDRFQAVADELSGLRLNSAIFDGELVAIRPDGTSSYRELPSVMGKTNQRRLRYYMFDVMHLNAKDVFIHISEVQQAGLTGLNEGEAIEFELSMGKNGREAAVNIKKAN